MEIIKEYLQILLAAFKYDMNIFSQGWIYYWLLVPAICYTVFFLIKWAVLTAPIWLPFKLVLESLKGLVKVKNYAPKKDKEKSEKEA